MHLGGCVFTEGQALGRKNGVLVLQFGWEVFSYFQLDAIKHREHWSMLFRQKAAYKFIWSVLISVLILCSVAAFEVSVI